MLPLMTGGFFIASVPSAERAYFVSAYLVFIFSLSRQYSTLSENFSLRCRYARFQLVASKPLHGAALLALQR